MYSKTMFVSLLLGVMASASVSAQRASITGNLKGLKEPVVFITIPVSDSAKTDTVAVKNGQFTWTGKISEPQKIYLGVGQHYTALFMENKAIKISGDADSLGKLTITGSATQDTYKAYETSLAGLKKEQHELNIQYGKVKDNASEKAAIEKKMEALDAQEDAISKAFIKTHPSSPVSVSLLSDMSMMGEYNTLDSLYQLLTPAAKQMSASKNVVERLAVLKKSAIGQPVMDFTQPDVNGKAVHLSDYKGKYVLLDFWASWCHPCRAENPNVLKAYNQFKDKNFTVVGVSLDNDGAKWKEAIAEDKMPWIELSDLKGGKNEVADQYGIMAIPESFLIDPQGIIIAKGLRGNALYEKLSSILQ